MAGAKESKGKGVLVAMNGSVLGAASVLKMNTVDCQVEEIGRFFHRIGSVGNYDAVDVRAFQKLVNFLCKSQPYIIVHVL